MAKGIQSRSSNGGDAITVQIISLHELMQKKKQLEDAITATKKYVLDYIGRNYLKNYEIQYTDTKQIIATRCERTKTQIDEQGMLESLKKSILKKICKTTYSVNVEGLKLVLEERPELKPILLRCICIEKHIDEGKLAQELEIGGVEFKDVEPFINTTKSYYLKMTEKDSEYAINGEKESKDE